MTGAAELTLALLAVLALLCLAVGYAVSRHNRAPPRSGFLPSDGATPQLRDHMAMIAKDLGCVATLTSRLAAAGRSDPGLAEVQRSVLALQRRLGATPPTYANVVALYRGLNDTSASVASAAAALEEGGKKGLGGPEDAARHRLAACLRSLHRQVHQLGASLDLE